MKKIPALICIITIAVAFSSCKMLNPNQMLRTGKNFKYNTFTDSVSVKSEYIIAPDDELSVMLFTNEGQKMIDPISNSGASMFQNIDKFKYIVQYDGKVKLPQLDYITIAGLTIKQAEQMLEKVYAQYYNDPFVQINVTNKRVIVFPGGDGGNAKVVYLKNANTTLFEALAEAGGITDGKAHKVKLIRGNLKNPQVYLIDLSTIKGVKEADLVVQANDIIYVQPRNKVPERIAKELTPYATILAMVLLIANLIK